MCRERARTPHGAGKRAANADVEEDKPVKDARLAAEAKLAADKAKQAAADPPDKDENVMKVLEHKNKGSRVFHGFGTKRKEMD